MTSAAKPMKQWGWEEKEAHGMNGQLQPLLLAGAVHLQAWRAFRSRRNEQLSELFPSPPLPMTIIN